MMDPAAEERETRLSIRLTLERFEATGMTFLTSFATMQTKQTPLVRAGKVPLVRTRFAIALWNSSLGVEVMLGVPLALNREIERQTAPSA